MENEEIELRRQFLHSESATPKSFQVCSYKRVERSFEKNRLLVALKGNRTSSGWKGAFYGASFICAAIFILYLFNIRRTFESNQIVVGAISGFVVLIGMNILVKNLSLILQRHARRSKTISEKAWEIDFGSSQTDIKSESDPDSSTYTRNFIFGQLLMVPALAYTWTSFLKDVRANSLSGIFALILSAWYLTAAVLTIRQTRLQPDSRGLQVKLKSFPLFLGQPAQLELLNNDPDSPVAISKISLHCIVEEPLEFENLEGRQLRKVAYSLFCEERQCEKTQLSSGFSLTFELPNRREFSTDFLAANPVYWKLIVEGTKPRGRVCTSFILPVYKVE